jgi:benzil reductase ((S)-benzoin forming)
MGVFHGMKGFINHVRSRDGEGVLINISSGASTSAYAGWGAYCAGKSAVDMLTEVAQIEEEECGLRAYSVAPGIIDTDMQELIRSTDAANFPLVEKFHELKRDDAFSSVEFVARSLLDLAFDPTHRPETVCSRLPIGK